MGRTNEQFYEIIGICEQCQNEVWGRRLPDGDLGIQEGVGQAASALTKGRRDIYSIMAVCSVPGWVRNCSCLACREWHARRAMTNAIEQLESLAGEYQVTGDDVQQVAEYLRSAMEFIDNLKRQHEAHGDKDADSQSES